MRTLSLAGKGQHQIPLTVSFCWAISMREYEKWSRTFGAAQPNPRTICGPSSVVTGSGNRFQAAMNRRYFGLSGL